LDVVWGVIIERGVARGGNRTSGGGGIEFRHWKVSVNVASNGSIYLHSMSIPRWRHASTTREVISGCSLASSPMEAEGYC
jgi:hypothetical protein